MHEAIFNFVSYIMYNIAPIRHLKCPHKTMVIIIDTGPAAQFPWHQAAWHRIHGMAPRLWWN